jgi:putative sigma-54 modulation protein
MGIEDYFEEDEQTIVRRKEVFLKPIDEEEAITQMELLGHTFFVFKNVDTNKINVVYKRHDGDYGIIEAN